jgi:Pput_2613-like deaminase/Annexin
MAAEKTKTEPARPTSPDLAGHLGTHPPEAVAGPTPSISRMLSSLVLFGDLPSQLQVAGLLQSLGNERKGRLLAEPQEAQDARLAVLEQIKSNQGQPLSKELEQRAIQVLGWEDLDTVARSRNPAFDAGMVAREVRGSMRGWGTEEDRLFAALEGLSPLELAAVRKAYAATYNREMADDIDDELSGAEQERATALLAGDATSSAVIALHDAMSGPGTDEATIMRALRGRSGAEIEAIKARYKEKYKADLTSDLDDELGGNERDQATALLAGDTSLADAIEINEAMAGPGTNEAAISAVYSRIRDEVEVEADKKGMTTAQVEAEVKRRTDAVKRAYGAKYASGPGADRALEDAYRSELSGGELSLVLAQQAVDQTAIDAAKIQVEHESLVTDDDKVNAVLRAQHERAEKEVMRDLEVELNRRAGSMTPEERAQARRQLQAQAAGLVEDRSKRYMADLERRYNAENPTRWGPGAFRTVLTLELSGWSRDEAFDLLKQGGKLTDAQELKYALFGPGTNEDKIKRTLRGKTKAQIEALGSQYKALTGNNLVEDLEADLSGRDAADIEALLGGTGTAEEKLRYLQTRTTWELGEGTGLGGLGAGEEEEVLIATTAQASAAYADYQRLRGQYGDNDPRTRTAKERLDRWIGYGEKDIEAHREAVDSLADAAATVGAVVAAAAIIAASGGTATPAVAALASAYATSVSVAIKMTMKGGGYGTEDLAKDLTVGAVEATAAYATFGVGNAIMRSGAFSSLQRLAERGVLGRMVHAGLTEGIENAISGVPSGMMSAALEESTWTSADPFAVLVNAAGTAAAQGFGVGMAMGSYQGFKEGRVPSADAARDAVEGRATTTTDQSHGPTDKVELSGDANPDTPVSKAVEEGPAQATDPTQIEKTVDATIEAKTQGEGPRPRHRGATAEGMGPEFTYEYHPQVREPIVEEGRLPPRAEGELSAKEAEAPSAKPDAPGEGPATEETPPVLDEPPQQIEEAVGQPAPVDAGLQPSAPAAPTSTPLAEPKLTSTQLKARLKEVRQQAAKLRKAARTDPEAAEALRQLYRAQPDQVLSRLRRTDPMAASVYHQRIPPNTELAKVLESEYRPPHEASVLHRDSTGKIKWKEKFTSGGMTPEEAVLGYPKSAQATHTEARAVAQAPLEEGDVLSISGAYNPCTPCQTAMTKASETGATINYWWPGGHFTARNGKGKLVFRP